MSAGKREHLTRHGCSVECADSMQVSDGELAGAGCRRMKLGSLRIPRVTHIDHCLIELRLYMFFVYRRVEDMRSNA